MLSIVLYKEGIRLFMHFATFTQWHPGTLNVNISTLVPRFTIVFIQVYNIHHLRWDPEMRDVCLGLVHTIHDNG